MPETVLKTKVMLSFQQAFYQLKEELLRLYDTHEAGAIAHELLEHITGKSKLHRLSEKDQPLTSQQEEELRSAKQSLLRGKPLQYVTGVQWFYGKPFQVNKHVLIPRPETEELIQWITDEWKNSQNISTLDIGTGSGCIPVSLKLQLPQSSIASLDINKDALAVARQNAEDLNAEVTFLQLDFLNEDNWEQLEKYDVIVSNPPYIPIAEKELLDKNVSLYEPEIALFVPDNDPLVFYRKLAVFGKAHLNADGAVYCEVHKDYAAGTQKLFEANNYKAELRKDMHGNDRMVKASPVT